MSGRSGKKKMSKLSRSARAGVIFPVGRLMRYLKKGTFKYRISVGAPVYMAAVIEYLAGKVPRGAGNPLGPSHRPGGCCLKAAVGGSWVGACLRAGQFVQALRERKGHKTDR